MIKGKGRINRHTVAQPTERGYGGPVQSIGDEAVAAVSRSVKAVRMPALAPVVVPSGEPEDWRPVVRFEGKYDVSDHGRVWSHRRQRMLALTETPLGYVVVCLSQPPARLTRKVHRLVLEAFVGPCPEGMETRHLDGDRRHNQLTNLMWGTPLENGADRIAHGNIPAHSQADCRRGGHALIGRNLILNRGHRKCRACVAARQLLMRRPDLSATHAELADALYAYFAHGGPNPYAALDTRELAECGGLWAFRQMPVAVSFRAADLRAVAAARGVDGITDNHARATLSRAVRLGEAVRLGPGLYRRICETV